MRRLSQDAEARPFPLTPTPIHVPDKVLGDLQRRLELTRWPEDAGNQDRSADLHPRLALDVLALGQGHRPAGRPGRPRRRPPRRSR